MPFIPVPNCAEAILRGKLAGADAFLTLGFEQDTPFDIDALADLTAVIKTWWDNTLSVDLSADLAMPDIKVTSLESDSAPTVTTTDFVQHTGQDTSPAVPANTALVVSFYTDSRGRSYRGRNFVPGMTRAALADASSWTVLSAAALQTDYEILAEDLLTTPFRHVVISRQHAGVPLATGVATHVTSYQGKTKVGTQRRRIAGTGS